jgi:diguanylate cyclase (GGDEF)-like protein
MHRIHRALNALPPAVILIVAAALVVGVGVLDQATGLYLSFALFYLLPVGLATWFCGRAAGFTISLMGSIMGLIGDVSSRDGRETFLAYWNAGMRFGIFIVVVVVLEKLRRSLASEQRLARTDPLTGAANARWFDEVAERAIAGMKRYGHPLTLAYVDVDNFKVVNDTLGHSVGDIVLRTVAEGMNASVRPTDLVARIGGDEFAVLMPHTDVEAAAAAFTRIRALLLDEILRHGWGVTLSVGIAAADARTRGVDELLAAADALMYEAKRAGKDRIAWDEAAVSV